MQGGILLGTFLTGSLISEVYRKFDMAPAVHACCLGRVRRACSIIKFQVSSLILLKSPSMPTCVPRNLECLFQPVEFLKLGQDVVGAGGEALRIVVT